jgi:hypothetical protein
VTQTVTDAVNLISVLFTVMITCFRLLPINVHNVNKRLAEINFRVREEIEKRKFVKSAVPTIVLLQAGAWLVRVVPPAPSSLLCPQEPAIGLRSEADKFIAHPISIRPFLNCHDFSD